MQKIVLIVIIAVLVVGGGIAAAVILLTRGGPSLTIASVELCSDVPGDRDYTVQPGATFERGDTVWLYFEASGVTSRGTDGQFEVWVKFADVKLYDPDGDVVVHVTDAGEIHETADEAVTYCWFYAWWNTTAGDATGQYRWEFAVTDELSGATGTGSATFTLEEPSLEEGLVAYYPFSGNANDESGNGNHGTVYGATLTEDRFGNANSAYSFDGVDDYIEVPDDDTLDLSDGLTISAWINSNSTSGARDIVSKWGEGLKRSYIFKDHNWSDKLRIELSKGGLSVLADLQGTRSITVGTWIHVCATYDSDSNTVKLYFNGTLDATSPASGIIASGDASLIIGGVGEPEVHECFWGILDDIRIYNYALSEAAIQALYYEGL